MPLDLRGKKRKLVGLGSYLVKAVADCWDCHADPAFTPAGDPDPQFAVGGDPDLGQPEKIELQGYLRGGRAFGPYVSHNLRPERGLGVCRPTVSGWPRHGSPPPSCQALRGDLHVGTTRDYRWRA